MADQQRRYTEVETEGHPDLDPDFPPYNPRHDSEALLLSALLWAGQRGDLLTVNEALNIVEAGDFYRPNYAKIFRAIQERAAEDRPTDSATVIATLSAKGAKDGMTTRDTTELMATLLGLQANDLLAAEYARQVLSLSYRRQFRRMVQRLAQIADEAPEDELFAQLVAQGKQQRAAWERFAYRRHPAPGSHASARNSRSRPESGSVKPR
ncbi:DnaB-like helicase N-terminal domain-containing protein [Corynebacterium gottingense]|uniref:DnaB-like helicase N-terminal domain-containing protein n=1 Tax=Corynebacterium gottingense TaxID=2041036 RepID=UPI0025B2A155|nr:DnaB-like helicase N-terminal domain-containing protein [Corynebacterium gottingense]WJZ16443.1 replicative DNA helicase [Corynebacterium gottingense]